MKHNIKIFKYTFFPLVFVGLITSFRFGWSLGHGVSSFIFAVVAVVLFDSQKIFYLAKYKNAQTTQKRKWFFTLYILTATVSGISAITYGIGEIEKKIKVMSPASAEMEKIDNDIALLTERIKSIEEDKTWENQIRNEEAKSNASVVKITKYKSEISKSTKATEGYRDEIDSLILKKKSLVEGTRQDDGIMILARISKINYYVVAISLLFLIVVLVELGIFDQSEILVGVSLKEKPDKKNNKLMKEMKAGQGFMYLGEKDEE